MDACLPQSRVKALAQTSQKLQLVETSSFPCSPAEGTLGCQWGARAALRRADAALVRCSQDPPALLAAPWSGIGPPSQPSHGQVGEFGQLRVAAGPATRSR